MHKAIVLFAHGARDPEWARPIESLRDRLRDEMADTRIAAAYLEFMQPGLGDAIASVVASGARAVTVVPVFLAQGGHVKRELPEMIAAARALHPEVVIEVTPAIGEQAEVIEAIARCVARLAPQLGTA